MALEIQQKPYIRGKAKRKIHARYPCLGGGTYQPPVLSVLYLQVGDLPGARALCLTNTKEGCLTTPGTLRIWQNVGDLRRKKLWYIMPVPGRFLENMGTHIFLKKGVPHTTRQLSGLWKNWAPSVDFFYGHSPENLAFWRSGCHWFLSNDYDFKYQAVRLLNRFLIYKTLDVNDNLHFYSKISDFKTVAQLSTVHVFSLCWQRFLTVCKLS